MNHSLVDTIAGSTLVGLVFTAVWWGIANAPEWLFIVGVALLCLVGLLMGLTAVCACVVSGRVEHSEKRQ